MTTLFRRLQPAKKFRITLTCIARLLKIPKHWIEQNEKRANDNKDHHTDKGGQFIFFRVRPQVQRSGTWGDGVCQILPLDVARFDKPLCGDTSNPVLRLTKQVLKAENCPRRRQLISLTET